MISNSLPLKRLLFFLLALSGEGIEREVWIGSSARGGAVCSHCMLSYLYLSQEHLNRAICQNLFFQPKFSFLLFGDVKMSDDEDEDKMGDADGDTESEKLSQPVDNPSDNKPGAPRCRLRSGTA